jgi:hypothetical protein
MQLSWNPPKITTTKATFTWGGSEAPYAERIHNGETYLGGRTQGRPWTDIGVAEFPFEQAFKTNYRGDLSTAFEQTMRDLSKTFDDVIDNYEFGNPSDRMKQYRDLPTNDRITDSGALRDSQTLTFE